jgi:hypothetical protein
MTSMKTWLVLGSVTIASALGCANPAVTEVAPGPPIAHNSTGGGSATTGKPATQPTAATGATTATTGTGGTGTSSTTGAAASASTGTAGTPAMSGVAGTPAATGAAGTPASMGAGGMMASAGTGASAGSTAMAGNGGAAGKGVMQALPACPADKGWTCQDPAKPLMDMGITNASVTDADGKPIAFACGNGGAVTCDMSNPKSSCPDLPDPFCAHVSIPDLGVDLYSCAQLCNP